MLRKVPIAAFAFLLFSLISLASLVAQTEDIKLGEIRYEARNDRNRYKIAIHMCLPAQKQLIIKAVRITYEPSGTVPIILYVEKCPLKEKSLLIEGSRRPLSSIESPSFEDFSPEILLDFPPQMAKDNMVKVDYLAERDGFVSVMSVASIMISDPEKVDFSITPLQ